MTVARLAAAAAMFAVVACGGGSSSSTTLQKQVAFPGQVPVSSTPRSTTPSSAPDAGACPASSPVACGALCCPSGALCEDGGCSQPATGGSCPANAPVACANTPTCSGGGCTAQDSSGLGNDAVLDGGFTLGAFGSGILARTDCAPVAIAPTRGFPTGNEPFTFEWWYRPPEGTSSGVQWFGGYGTDAPGEIRGLVWDDTAPDFTGRLTFASEDPDQGADNLTYDTLGQARPGWHFYGVSYDGGTSTFFFDGQPMPGVYAVSSFSSPLVTPSGTSFVVGGMPALGAQTCTQVGGTFDEVRVVAAALPPSQIAADFSGPMSAIPGTVGLWHFDEGATVRCCPSGTGCGANGTCAVDAGAIAPSSCSGVTPQSCGDGTCCPASSSCTGGTCLNDSAPAASCPASAPVSCPGELCCPTGFACAADGGCVSPPIQDAGSLSPTPICTSGEMDVQATAGTPSMDICCPPTANLFGANPGSALSCGANWSATCGENATVGNCSPGYGDQGSCTGCSAPGTILTCPNGGVSCGNKGAMQGTTGCCPGGYVCSEAADSTNGYYAFCVLPSCGAGYCPLGAQCDVGAGTCHQDAVSAICTSGTLCGSSCCAGSETCVAGRCETTSDPAACPAEAPVLCGASCCPDGTVCGSTEDPCVAPPEAPSCDAGETPCGTGGICCASGTTCLPDGTCELASSPVPHDGPQGPECGAGEYCDTSEVCSNGACCPTSDPTACGGDCCPSGTTCEADSQCSCPTGETECGTECCGAGDSCVDGACMTSCSSASAPTPCGSVCCATGSECQDAAGGQCSCPSDTPTPCGDVCCGPSAICQGGQCKCANGGAACNGVCCPDGQICSGGRCADPPSCSGDDQPAQCPDGSELCCSIHMVCCHDSANGGAIGCQFAGFCE